MTSVTSMASTVLINSGIKVTRMPEIAKPRRPRPVMTSPSEVEWKKGAGATISKAIARRIKLACMTNYR